MFATHRSFILALIPTLTIAFSLVGCGDDPEPEPGPDTSAISDEPEYYVPRRDTGYDPRNEEIFEEIIIKEYAILRGQISREYMDSVLQAVMKRGGTPADANKILEVKLLQQDSLARYSIGIRYGISQDSIEAILKEEVAQNRAK